MEDKAHIIPSGFQILLVEDNEADARLFEHALHEAAPRAKLYWVASGSEALEYLHQQGRFEGVGPVSLVISDLNMPGVSGYELLSRVKKDSAFRSIPFIVYSGSHAPTDINQCYAIGANSYIVKPMTVDSLIEQLRVLVHYWLETVKLPEQYLLD